MATAPMRPASAIARPETTARAGLDSPRTVAAAASASAVQPSATRLSYGGRLPIVVIASPAPVITTMPASSPCAGEAASHRFRTTYLPGPNSRVNNPTADTASTHHPDQPARAAGPSAS